MAKRLGLSPLTGKVYYANINDQGLASGKKIDVTQSFIDTVIQWLGENGQEVWAGDQGWDISIKRLSRTHDPIHKG